MKATILIVGYKDSSRLFPLCLVYSAPPMHTS